MVSPFEIVMGLFGYEPVKPTNWAIFCTYVMNGVEFFISMTPQWFLDRTNLERWLMVFLAVLLSHYVLRVVIYVKQICVELLWYRRMLYGPKIVKAPQIEYIPESAIPGSHEMPLTRPSCQCGIMVENENGDHVLVGNAVRFPFNYLVGPDHVLNDNDVKIARGRQGYISLAGKERIPITTDLVAIKLQQEEFSRIGLSASVVKCIENKTATASVVSYHGRGTVSLVSLNNHLFGHVTYSGTTQPGYSGAAYTVGNTVVGVHVYGGRTNGGINASYIYAVLNRLETAKNEDSAEWLAHLFRDHGEITYQEHGLDEVMIHRNGRFDLVNRSSVIKAFGPDYANSSGKLRKIKRREYDDVIMPEIVDFQPESCSGESHHLKNSGASSVLGKPRNSENNEHLQLMSELNKLSVKQARKARLCVQALSKQDLLMLGQTPNDGPQTT